jgi:K+-sensing histidine kinase KdpD
MICRSIVEAPSGRLNYEPNPQGGSIFRFNIPAFSRDAEADGH